MSTKAVGSAGAIPADAHGHAPGVNYLNCDHGFRSWFFTLDHKRISVMYLASILTMFLLGGILALLVRTELLTPTRTIVDADTYNRFFTLHGAVMIFLFIIPGIPAALGNFVLPMMLGAKDVALPRLNLLSYHLYVVGALVSVGAIVLGGVDTGWTFYTPYSTSTGGPVVLVTLGVFILGFSSIFTGLNFIVTIHKMRPAGMGWFRMPLMLWALYATAVIQVLATPVLGITVLLLIAERTLGIGIFDPALGGDPVLFQHFFWFYSHPAVYIMILPAMGIMSELISVFSRKTIFGYKAIAYSSIAIAVFSFLVWGHHMFVSGQSALANMVFSALTFSVSIPSAVKVFNWLATMYKGSIRLDDADDLRAGVHLAVRDRRPHRLVPRRARHGRAPHDTYFIVAHFHYTMMGGVLIAFLGGIFYWWPKMFGRMYSEKWGRIAATLVFIGFNVTFFTQFIMGAKGMPRRYYNYPPEFEIYHQISTAGSYLLAIGLFMAAGVLLHSLINGRKAPRNPWGAATLEWQSLSPPVHYNFDEELTLTDPYDFSGLTWSEAEQGYVPKETATT